MKGDIEQARRLAEDIALNLYEAGFGAPGQLVHVVEFSRAKVADMIMEHDKILLREAHARYINAVKKCGD